MHNAVGKYSSTLRTKILILLGLLTVLLIHNTYFQLRQLDNPISNRACYQTKPFMKPDLERQPPVSRIPKSESLTKN